MEYTIKSEKEYETSHFCNLPMPIFEYSFPQLITMEVCHEYRKSFPQSNTTNVHAWHSDYYTHKRTDSFKPVIDACLNACNDISSLYFRALVANEWKYIIDHLWLAMYEQSDYTSIHAHFPSTFAACYYVDVEDDCSPITFGMNDELSIQPKNGMLLIWMGIIPHKVEPTNKKRTCICMNVSMKKNIKSDTDSIPIFY